MAVDLLPCSLIQHQVGITLIQASPSRASTNIRIVLQTFTENKTPYFLKKTFSCTYFLSNRVFAPVKMREVFGFLVLLSDISGALGAEMILGSLLLKDLTPSGF